MLLISLPYIMGLITPLPQCGAQGGYRRCLGGQCCSKFGYCGFAYTYCGVGYCQNQCLLDVPVEAITQARVEAQAQLIQAQAVQTQAAGAP